MKQIKYKSAKGGSINRIPDFNSRVGFTEDNPSDNQNETAVEWINRIVKAETEAEHMNRICYVLADYSHFETDETVDNTHINESNDISDSEFDEFMVRLRKDSTARKSNLLIVPYKDI